MQPCGKCISRASCIRTRLADENHACANKGASYSSCSVASETKREAQEPRACTFCCTKMFPSFPLAPFTSLRSFSAFVSIVLRHRKSPQPVSYSPRWADRFTLPFDRSVEDTLVLRFCLNIPYSRLVAEPRITISHSKPKTSQRTQITNEIYNRREILKVNFHQPN